MSTMRPPGHSFSLGFINGYTPSTLENNWNEDRFDLNYVKELKPMPSDYDHSFSTTYKELTKITQENAEADKNLLFTEKHRFGGYPGHQPELDTKLGEKNKNTYETDVRVNYLDPRLKRFPLDLNTMFKEELKASNTQ